MNRLDREVLLAFALGIDRLELFKRDYVEPPGFEALLARRAAGEPVAYITGRRAFRHLELHVDRRVLIPRPETEHLVETALSLPLNAAVVDVGTGSGAVALALKHERPDLRITATDISADALAVARANAERLGLDVTFVEGDLLAGVRADAVVSNPPYVSPDYDGPPELAYEPAIALFGDVYDRLVAEALASGASFIAVEVGERAIDHLFPSPVTVVKDLAGHDRVVVWPQV